MNGPLNRNTFLAFRCDLNGCTLGSNGANKIIEAQFFNFNGTEYVTVEPGDQFSAWAGYWAKGLAGANGVDARLVFSPNDD